MLVPIAASNEDFEAAGTADTLPIVTLVVDAPGSPGVGYATAFANTERTFITVDGRPESLAAVIDKISKIDRIVVFLPAGSSPSFDTVLERCAMIASDSPGCRVCIVGSFRAHFGDTAYLRMEADAIRRFPSTGTNRSVVLRVGNVEPAVSSVSLKLRALAPFYPLCSRRFRSCYIERGELFATIEEMLRDDRSRRRVVTLLGRNRTLRETARDRVVPGFYSAVVIILARLLALLLLGRLVGLVVAQIARHSPPLRRLTCDTLEPKTVDELLCLYNSYNHRHVALAGYNTGVTHFGWKYPGRTIVKTTGCGRLVRIRDSSVTVDAGVTIKRVVGELNRVGRQLYVVPNYSYVSLGTTFFVPIHGSAGDVSTLGDTIQRVLFYDPTIDRLVSRSRGEPAFERLMYAPRSGILALRLTLRVRSQLRYFKQTTELKSPTAAEVWRLFSDSTASNIELRKSRATDDIVHVSKYRTTPAENPATADEHALEIPRDSIGRIWDRLEENPLTSALFHGFVRRFGFHVELFLDADEFPIFWEAHTKLPLSKIQLRFVRCDGLAHSPFGQRDCISADLFMRRSANRTFLRFMKEQLPNARFNPGKHSM